MAPGIATGLHWFALGLLFVMGVIIIIAPRRLACLPIFIITYWITLGQVVEIGPFHFYLSRIIVLIGLIRVIARGELLSIQMTNVDRMVIFWALSNITIFLVYRFDSIEEALVNRSGFVLDALGTYFLFRSFMQDFDDMFSAIRLFGIVVLPIGGLMMIEYVTRTNYFAIFGAVLDTRAMWVDRIRCTGPFRSPIIAGTFGATLIPVFLTLWFQEEFKDKLLAIAGIIAATAITMTSGSGGPLSAYIFAIIALLFWPLRRNLRKVQWAIVGFLIFFDIATKAPIWYLSARISSVVGGGGWHRAYLIDQAIAHFDEWWLLGTNYTAHWVPYHLAVDPRMVDITNMILAQGIEGGLLTMILFILLIVLCFKGLGLAIRLTEEQPLAIKIIPWCFGAALVAHTASFMGISYFDQMHVSWTFFLAAISAIINSLVKPHIEPAV